MDDITQERAKKALDRIGVCLKWYAQNRDPDLYVGQFLDEEGCGDNQMGTYGMSIWLILTNDLLADTKISALREKCKEGLKERIRKAKSKINRANASLSPSSEEYEILNILPKISYLFTALNTIPDTKTEAQFLQKRVADAQKDDGSWGFFYDSSTGNSIVTSLILRAFRDEPSFIECQKKGLAYIKQRFSEVQHLYERLFVINTVLLLDKHDVYSERKIKEIIKQIYKKSYYDPTFFSLINIDYNDIQAKRTRYFRLPTDMILLESLTLLSDGSLQYLRIHSGYRILYNLNKRLEQSSKFTKDVSDHRASVGIFCFIDETLRLIASKRILRLPSILKDIHAWWDYNVYFGLDFTWNLFSLIISTVLALFLLHMQSSFSQLFIGISIKTLFDIARNVFNLIQSRSEP